MYLADTHLIEVLYDEDFTITFIINEDIYFITGDQEAYTISKNGTSILIDGINQEPTGVEIPEWNDDVINIMEIY